MIYYNEDKILIRDMQQSDAQKITDEEIAQGWDADISKYEMRLKHQAEGKSISLVAEYDGNVAGYINIYPDSEWGAFASQIPRSKLRDMTWLLFIKFAPRGGVFDPRGVYAPLRSALDEHPPDVQRRQMQASLRLAPCVRENKGYPEIVDFGVLEKYRRNGVGSKLMDIAEQTAMKYSDTVYLGVGMHYGYGSAQRMYVKRGYIPDGTGVWYKDKVCEQYADCCNDDDLVLYLSKKLR